MLKKELSTSCSHLENIINSVFSKANVNLFLIDQLFNISSTVLHFEDSFSMLSSLIATVVSTAKSVKFYRLDKVGSSNMYTRSTNGPNILP